MTKEKLNTPAQRVDRKGKPIPDWMFENDPDLVPNTGVEDMTDEEFEAELEDIGVGHLLPDGEKKTKP